MEKKCVFNPVTGTCYKVEDGAITGKCGCQDKVDWKKKLRLKARKFYLQGAGASHTEEYALDLSTAEEFIEGLLVNKRQETIDQLLEELKEVRWLSKKTPTLLKAQGQCIELGSMIEEAIYKVSKM